MFKFVGGVLKHVLVIDFAPKGRLAKCEGKQSGAPRPGSSRSLVGFGVWGLGFRV